MAWATSCHSEKDGCSKSTVECDTNREGDHVLKYNNVMGTCMLSKMHAQGSEVKPSDPEMKPYAGRLPPSTAPTAPRSGARVTEEWGMRFRIGKSF